MEQTTAPIVSPYGQHPADCDFNHHAWVRPARSELKPEAVAKFIIRA